MNNPINKDVWSFVSRPTLEEHKYGRGAQLLFTLTARGCAEEKNWSPIQTNKWISSG